MPSFLEIVSKFQINKPLKLLHIGANYGQEAKMYAALGIEAWHVEAIPEVFKVMSENISGLEAQHAICACLSDTDDEEVTFNIANNDGQSSSMLPLGRHAISYPTIEYVNAVALKTRTVDSLAISGEIPWDIDFILIDAQGAEFMILRGAEQILSAGNVNGLLIETAVEPLYEKGATYLDVGVFLQSFDLHLCQAIFNMCGWTDALYSKPYWRRPPAKILTTGVNIAPLAKSEQSSIYGSENALKAFSGIRTGGYAFHTKFEKKSWIKLAFESELCFHEILVFNRLGECQDRSINIDTLVSSDDANWDLIHENRMIFGGIDGNPLRISCPNSKARYILFRLRDENYLHLDSIEIYS